MWDIVFWMVLSVIVNFPVNGCLIVLTEILTEEQKKEELEKLYSAIGYSEGEVITAYPKEVDCIFSCIYMYSVQLNQMY